MGRDYQRCPDCRRRFGGAEAFRVAHTTQGRCKTVRELRRNRLHRRADGVWGQSPPAGGWVQLRMFRLGRPGTPLRLVYLQLATTLGLPRQEPREAAGTTNPGGPESLPIGEAA